MKKLFFILFAAVVSLSAMAQDPREAKWDAASSAYAANDYSAAIRSYEELAKEGVHNWELYYNLGAAYFKDNQLGRAILNFERASLLDAGNEDIEHNLAVAQSRTIDKIESVPQFFVVEWITTVGGFLSADNWAVLSVVLMALALGLVVLWRLKKSHAAAVSAIVVAALMFIGFMYAHNAYSAMGQSDSAIVVNTASVVRSSPDQSGKELFVLHEGAKVLIVDQIGSWVEVRIASGNKGWLAVGDVEKI